MIGRKRQLVLLALATATPVAVTLIGDHSAATDEMDVSADVFSGASLVKVYGTPNDLHLYTGTELADAADIASVMQGCVYCTRDDCPADQHKAIATPYSEYYEGDGHGSHVDCRPNSYVVDCGAGATEHPLAEPTGCRQSSPEALVKLESRIRAARAEAVRTALRDLVREDDRVSLNEDREALQVETCSGLIVGHYPLTASQVEAILDGVARKGIGKSGHR